MKLHTGKLKNAVDVVTHASGTRIEEADGRKWFNAVPHDITMSVKRLFGLSTRSWFVGVMKYEKTET